MRPNSTALMLALLMGAVGVDANAVPTSSRNKTPRRFTDERKAAAEAKRARKRAKRAANHG